MFMAMHPKEIRERISPCLVGPLVDDEPSQIDSEWRDLVEEVEKGESFSRAKRETFYGFLFARLAAMFAVVCLGVMGSSSYAVHILSAVLLGFTWQQIAFVGHDGGHNSVVGWSVQSHELFGVLMGNVLTGISMGWWKATHHVHHAVCNSTTHDPDIQHMPLIAVTPKLFNVYSLYHFRRFPYDTATRIMVSLQYYTFLPIMGVARLNLYAQGFIRLVKERHSLSARTQALEWGGLGLFALWFSAFVRLLPPSHRLPFVLVAWFTTGLLHLQIVSSHFSRPTFTGQPGKKSWFELQLDGTLDYECKPEFDWFHGGLQFQIEHHLFPRAPRYHLRKLKPLVKAFAKRHNVEYHEVSFLGALKEVMDTLAETAKFARKTDHVNFSESLIWQAANLEG